MLSGLSALAGVGGEVEELVADPPEKLRAYLRLCARNRQMIPGAFVWRLKGDRVTDIRCDGTLVRVRPIRTPIISSTR